MANDNVRIIKDFGAFGPSSYGMCKHLTLCSWYGREPRLDIRAWSEDMSKCGKGVTLEQSELVDLQDLIPNALKYCGEPEEE